MEKNIPDKKEESNTSTFLMEHNILITWKPEYNLGIPIIDDQHKGIVSIINTLYFSIQHNYAWDILSPIIDMVYDYTHIHFDIEEKFLDKINYPRTKFHRELHYILLAKLRSAERNSVLKKDPEQFMEFLKSWWINHICEEDLIYRDYILGSMTI